jgi:putative phage-type endonuclease
MARKIADTKKMTHEEWLELRKSSIGGSDAATCVNMNQYSSLISLYADKKGLSKEKEDNEAMRLGRDLEQYVAERFCEKTGKKVRNDFFMYEDDEYPFLTANIDRRVVGENAGLECKTMGSFNGYDLANGEIPSHYYCQCQHYCMVLGFSKVYLAILVLQRGLYTFEIYRNDDFIRQMRDAEVDFWTNYVEKDEVPEPDGSDASLATLKEFYPNGEENEIQIAGLDRMIQDYKAASGREKEAKELKTSIQAKICAKLGNNAYGLGIDYGCSWKNQSKESVDTKRLKAELPKVYEKYAKVSEYRVFRTKKIKK